MTEIITEEETVSLLKSRLAESHIKFLRMEVLVETLRKRIKELEMSNQSPIPQFDEKTLKNVKAAQLAFWDGFYDNLLKTSEICVK